jgi:hypothetical protein
LGIIVKNDKLSPGKPKIPTTNKFDVLIKNMKISFCVIPADPGSGPEQAPMTFITGGQQQGKGEHKRLFTRPIGDLLRRWSPSF